MPIVRRGSRYRGMGMYPGSPCYDPTRPDWVPYWWDTPSESGCKFGLYPSVTTLATPPTPPALSAPAAPQTLDQMQGNYSPDQSMLDTQSASQQAASNFLNTVNTAPACNWSNATLDPSTWCISPILLLSGLAIGGLLLFGGKR